MFQQSSRLTGLRLTVREKFNERIHVSTVFTTDRTAAIMDHGHLTAELVSTVFTTDRTAAHSLQLRRCPMRFQQSSRLTGLRRRLVVASLLFLVVSTVFTTDRTAAMRGEGDVC